MKCLWLSIVVIGCSGSDDVLEDTGQDVGCGDPSSHDVRVLFEVVDASGNGVSNLEVRLEDRAWEPGTLGSGTTDGNGTGELLAAGVTDLPNCWGTMLDYVVVVEDPSAYYAAAEKPVNSYLHGAIDDGSLEADLTSFPIEVSAE